MDSPLAARDAGSPGRGAFDGPKQPMGAPKRDLEDQVDVDGIMARVQAATSGQSDGGFWKQVEITLFRVSPGTLRAFCDVALTGHEATQPVPSWALSDP